MDKDIVELKREAEGSWRRIETDPPPKDGTRILVIGLPPYWKGYPFVVHWNPARDDGKGWWQHTDPSLDELYAVSDSITHWMPCPTPPLRLIEGQQGNG